MQDITNASNVQELLLWCCTFSALHCSSGVHESCQVVAMLLWARMGSPPASLWASPQPLSSAAPCSVCPARCGAQWMPRRRRRSSAERNQRVKCSSSSRRGLARRDAFLNVNAAERRERNLFQIIFIVETLWSAGCWLAFGDMQITHCIIIKRIRGSCETVCVDCSCVTAETWMVK